MRRHSCPVCNATVYFHNAVCGACGTGIAYNLAKDAFVAGANACSNASKIGCNWVGDDPSGKLCRSCRMTVVIPDLVIEPNTTLWAESEMAKRWVLATLNRWGWFGPDDSGQLPEFKFKSEHTVSGDQNVTMGHASGVITLDVAEADDAIRTRNREMLDEDYRTMLGHLRHELAHFLFERLSAEPGFTEAFRALFGDERTDYAAALDRHYSGGPPPDWQQSYVSPYASVHPHEDWAETAAHLMHLTDIVDTALAVDVTWPSNARPPLDAYATRESSALIRSAVDLGLALNQVNRAMGISDLYPFVLTDKVREKLELAHFWLNRPSRA